MKIFIFITIILSLYCSKSIKSEVLISENNCQKYTVLENENIVFILKKHSLYPIFGKEGSLAKTYKLQSKNKNENKNLVYKGDVICLPQKNNITINIKTIENKKIDNVIPKIENNPKENIEQKNISTKICQDYTIHKGDTLFTILMEKKLFPIFGKIGSLEATLKLNSLSDKDIKNLKINSNLCLPFKNNLIANKINEENHIIENTENIKENEILKLNYEFNPILNKENKENFSPNEKKEIRHNKIITENKNKNIKTGLKTTSPPPQFSPSSPHLHLHRRRRLHQPRRRRRRYGVLGQYVGGGGGHAGGVQDDDLIILKVPPQKAAPHRHGRLHQGRQVGQVADRGAVEGAQADVVEVVVAKGRVAREDLGEDDHLFVGVGFHAVEQGVQQFDGGVGHVVGAVLGLEVGLGRGGEHEARDDEVRGVRAPQVQRHQGRRPGQGHVHLECGPVPPQTQAGRLPAKLLGDKVAKRDALAAAERDAPIVRHVHPVERGYDVVRFEDGRCGGDGGDGADEDAFRAGGERVGFAQGGGLQALPLDAEHGEPRERARPHVVGDEVGDDGGGDEVATGGEGRGGKGEPKMIEPKNNNASPSTPPPFLTPRSRRRCPPLTETRCRCTDRAG